jgi:hypothetical protein
MQIQQRSMNLCARPRIPSVFGCYGLIQIHHHVALLFDKRIETQMCKRFDYLHWVMSMQYLQEPSLAAIAESLSAVRRLSSSWSTLISCCELLTQTMASAVTAYRFVQSGQRSLPSDSSPEPQRATIVPPF